MAAAVGFHLPGSRVLAPNQLVNQYLQRSC